MFAIVLCGVRVGCVCVCECVVWHSVCSVRCVYVVCGVVSFWVRGFLCVVHVWCMLSFFCGVCLYGVVFGVCVCVCELRL